MSNNKNYIKLKYTEYGYEIYVITRGKKIKLNKQNKIIMRKVLNKFQCIKANDFTYIYPKYGLITLYFSREKLKFKFKKVNRDKSRQIAAGILALTTFAGGLKVVNDILLDVDNESSSATVEVQDEEIAEFDNDIAISGYEGIYVYDDTDNVEFLDNLNEFVEIENEEETIPEIEIEAETTPEMEHVNEFCYEFDNPNDKEALVNAE